NLRHDTKCDAKEGIINAPVDNCDCDDLSVKCDLCGHSRLLDQPSGRNYQFTCDGPNSEMPVCIFVPALIDERIAPRRFPGRPDFCAGLRCLASPSVVKPFVAVRR